MHSCAEPKWFFLIYGAALFGLNALFDVSYNHLPLFLQTTVHKEIAIPLILLLNVGDWDSTKRCFKYQRGRELNPLMRRLLEGKTGYSFESLKLGFVSSLLIALGLVVADGERLAIMVCFLWLVIHNYYVLSALTAKQEKKKGI